MKEGQKLLGQYQPLNNNSGVWFLTLTSDEANPNSGSDSIGAFIVIGDEINTSKVFKIVWR